MSSMEDSEVIDRRKLFVAAMDGNIGFFEEARNREIENCDEEYFLRQTSSDKYNILHIAIKYRQFEFIEKVFVEGLLPRAVTDKLIYQRDVDGNTPLHAAAEEGYIEVFEKLLEYGKGQPEANKEAKPLDWRVKNEDGNTPLHVALLKRKFKAAEWLVKQHSELVVMTNNDENTPFHVAAALGDTNVFKVLLNESVQWQPWRLKNKDGNTPLHVAIINYSWAEIPKLLLDQDSELARATNNSKETPLHLAIIKFPFLGDIVQKLEDKNNHRFLGISMEPDLENAAKHGDVGFLKEARHREIENGNYFMGQNSNGDNILHIAIRSEQYEFMEQVAKMLLPRSIIDMLINQRNNHGDTLFHVAAEVGNERILKLLLEFDESGKWYVRNSDGNLPNQQAAILNFGDNLLPTNNNSFEVFHYIIGLIRMLLKKDKSVACWHDEGGLTPLHRASFTPDAISSLILIKMILAHCSESAKEVDKNSGKTILHFLINRVYCYQQGKDMSQYIQEIDSLKDVKDREGNTPLDLAWISNFKMARLLFHSSTTTSHAQQRIHFDQMKKEKKKRWTLEEYGVIDGVNIQTIREKISKFGINFLSSRDSKRRNVLHNLMQLERRTPIKFDEYLDFITQVVGINPILSAQTDINGDTPIHILMQNPPDTKIYCSTTQSLNRSDVTYTSLTKSSLPFELMMSSVRPFVIGQGLAKDFKYDDPQLVQNVEGNTPLHEALKANHILPASLMINYYFNTSRSTFGMSNKRKETVLHLLVGSSLVEWPPNVIKKVQNANEEAAISQDQDGLTPMMRAVQVGHIDAVKTLDDLNPEASKIVDNNGQTLWHMLVNQPSSKTEEFVDGIGEKQHLIDLLKIPNKEGKTPLHLALESRRFTHARLFLKCSYDEWSSTEKLNWMKALLEIQDGDGITSGDRLASISDLPQDMEKLLSEDPIELMGFRSVYGISTVEMKDYVNTMGVIAALLTTITFTAAFTVPGGAVQDDKDVKDKHAVGTPLLVKSVAFQAFMFFDILTMCLSTMVLFCLLWIFATGSRRKSVILMDFSILLLLISFYTTLVSFMAGVYATTIHVKPWIAIYTLVMCLSLMVLMQKYLVIKFLGPVGPIVTSAARKYFRYLRDLKLCKKVKDMVCHASNTSAPLPHRD